MMLLCYHAVPGALAIGKEDRSATPNSKKGSFNESRSSSVEQLRTWVSNS